ncbi:MAG: DUF3786 domain-containing protein [Desulfococcaceae bacterium]
MTQPSDIFEKHCQDYCHQMAKIDFEAVKNTLGIEQDGEKMFIPFFSTRYAVSTAGIADISGSKPDYAAFVILAKYILLCPDQPYLNPEWVSFRDFKRTSHFTNVNFFSSDTERAMEKHFSGRMNKLEKACEKMGGIPHKMETAYDLSMQFQALPRVSLLLLFNDGDEEFAAKGTVLFQKQAEYYLDPESLAITSAFLVRSLKMMSKE